eukprot:Hpha_TRINITY_DN11211_c0_g1::TRINITY_DN11211_c0_g1_i1::g.167673::m.167673
MSPREMLAVLVVAAVFPVVVAEAPTQDQLMKKKVRELRDMLDERGVVCEDCYEKTHLVSRVIETYDMPKKNKKKKRSASMDKGPPKDRVPVGDVVVAKDGSEWRKEDFLRQMNSAFSTQGEAAPEHAMAEQLWQDWGQKLRDGEIQPPSSSGFSGPFGGGWMYWIGLLTMPLFLLVKHLEKEQAKKERNEAELKELAAGPGKSRRSKKVD